MSSPFSKKPKNSLVYRRKKPSSRKLVTYGWVKMVLIFIVLITLALSLGLVQAAMVSKQAFYERLETYMNFANPNYRFVYIYPGMRREEIVNKYSKALAWNDKDKRWFVASAPANSEDGSFMDGYFLPKTYFVDKDATGQEVGQMMHEEFLAAVSKRVLGEKESESKDKAVANAINKKTATATDGTKKIININTAITIASIIQREAAGPHDMNLISGIIWNRIFRGMNLELDATLQYAKGNEDNWWPQVNGKDKYIESPYNTYKNKGLPPGAISNPSIDAINAAYNPKKTDCIFYLHDNNRKIHCSKTYEEHKRNVDTYLR